MTTPQTTTLAKLIGTFDDDVVDHLARKLSGESVRPCTQAINPQAMNNSPEIIANALALFSRQVVTDLRRLQCGRALLAMAGAVLMHNRAPTDLATRTWLARTLIHAERARRAGEAT